MQKQEIQDSSNGKKPNSTRTGELQKYQLLIGDLKLSKGENMRYHVNKHVLKNIENKNRTLKGLIELLKRKYQRTKGEKVFGVIH